MTSVNFNLLAASMLDAFEALGAKFYPSIDPNDSISFSWLCAGILNTRECRRKLTIVKESHPEFRQAFLDIMIDRFCARVEAGRLA